MRTNALSALLADLRYGIRMLLKDPALSLVAVLSLALGIGANTAVFSLINAVMLKLLPVDRPEQLVALTNPNEGGVSIGTSTGVRGILSYPEFLALKERTNSYSGMFATESQLGRSNASINGSPVEEVKARLVSGEYFQVLGVSASIGRVFGAADEHGFNSAPYAVASYAYWQKRFGGSAKILDSRIRVGKAVLRVIGVADPLFRGENVGEAPDLWVPMVMEPLTKPGRMWLADDPSMAAEKVMWLHVIGRLKAGETRQRAQAEANVVFRRIVAEEFSKVPETDRKRLLDQRLELHDAANGISYARGDFAEPLFVLMAVVGLVLLIACANVANLMLARAASRQKEVGVRIALGAKRSRIVRQFLTESLLLALCGGAAGVLFAYAGVHLLLRMVQNGPDPLALDVQPDARILLFTAGISVLTGLIFGLAPALKSMQVDVNHTLKEAGRGMTGSGSKIGLGKMLVIAQIAISLLLLIGAGWFLRTLQNLENVQLGYPRDKLLLVGLDPLAAGYEGARLPQVYLRLRDRFARMPGVRSVTFSVNGIFSGSESGDRISVEGFKAHKRSDEGARFDQIGPRYFSVIGAPLLLGREFAEQDAGNSPPVCVVNQTFAKFYFGQASPIGKHITDEFPDNRRTFEIVGVAKDMRDHSLRGELPRRFYVPALQPYPQYPPFMNFEIRTFADPSALAEAARKAVREVDANLPLLSTRTVEELIDRRVHQERLIAQLSSAFGAVALLLACIGLYGVLSYAVARRTSEIGIRMALGAEQGAVVRMILRETALLVAIGLGIGLPVSLGCARFVQSRMFGLKAADPLILSVTIAIMVAVAIGSGLIPARRAARVDPMKALRYE